MLPVLTYMYWGFFWIPTRTVVLVGKEQVVVTSYALMNNVYFYYYHWTEALLLSMSIVMVLVFIYTYESPENKDGRGRPQNLPEIAVTSFLLLLYTSLAWIPLYWPKEFTCYVWVELITFVFAVTVILTPFILVFWKYFENTQKGDIRANGQLCLGVFDFKALWLFEKKMLKKLLILIGIYMFLFWYYILLDWVLSPEGSIPQHICDLVLSIRWESGLDIRKIFFDFVGTVTLFHMRACWEIIITWWLVEAIYQHTAPGIKLWWISRKF